MDKATAPILRIRDASLRIGPQTLWSGLNLDVQPGEFLAVLGPNGAGKTSFLKAILGQRPLSSGSLSFQGRQVARGHRKIGYIPQQSPFPANTPLRGRDLVGLGVDGMSFFPRIGGKEKKEKVDDLLARVGAQDLANKPVGLLSGGEQQRLRTAQALAHDPQLLLCDEPLLSLDLHHQRIMSNLIAQQAREGTAVVFVTHEINPVIDAVDRVLYFAQGGFRVGTPEEVLQSDTLSELYGSKIDVLRLGGRVVVLGTEVSA